MTDLTALEMDGNDVLAEAGDDERIPQPLEVEVEGAVQAVDDAYSDRIRCDHPLVEDPEVLGRELLDAAEACGRGRVVVLARRGQAPGWMEAGYQREGLIPGFYEGREDCVVLGAYPDPERGELAHPEAVEQVHELIEGEAERAPGVRRVVTRRADQQDAPAIAELLAATFPDYPTPSHDPAYVAQAIEEGNPFRLVEEDGQLLACASADLVVDARTAELTDCATRPSARRRGLMQAILVDLMGDLRTLGYPTAFTLARARIPGVNLAFRRLGFELRGTMAQSCRIGEGLEDMNILSRRLDPAA